MDQLHPTSHLLEHLVDMHEGEEKDEIKLRLRIGHSKDNKADPGINSQSARMTTPSPCKL